jgi:transglutaminase-like putative cysteine protease
VADQLTPDGFRNRTPGGGQSTTAGMPPVMAASQPGVTSRSYKAQVQVVALDMRMLPIYLQPTRTEKLDSSWLYDRTNQVVYSRRNQARGKSYTFDYARLDYSPEALRTARPLDDGDPIQRTYTDVPKVAEVEKVVREITAGKQTQYDKVRAIHAYFSTANGFQYSLKTQDGTSGSAIVDFLRNKQGFCEQYSAAMAWLVRSAGIPARVAFGFSRGGKSGDTWTMTNRNLHAWTEVYFDRYGWIPFDATPASFVGGVDSAWAPDPNKKEDAGGNSPNGNLPGGPPVDSSGSAGPATNLPNQRGELPEGTGQAPPAPAWPLWTLAGLLVALLLAASPAVWRARLRRRRWPDAVRGPAPVNVTVAPGSRDVTVTDDSAAVRARLRAHAAWDELIDTMIDHRLPVDDAATPRMTAERLVTESALTGAAATGARQLGHAEERARYARSPLHGDDLAGSLRAVRGAIAGRVSWRTRVRAVVAPASVLDRWQVAVTRTSGQVTETVGRWADTVSRAASLRRWLRLRRS